MPKKATRLRNDRPTLFDSLHLSDTTNIFCDRNDLNNESTVEQRFALRLLNDLGYADADIQPKDQISPVMVSMGRKKLSYRPDFQILFKGRVGWMLDAKATTESLDKWAGQCASYCFEINKDRDESERARFFMLTNGNITKVYPWDSNSAILELDFADFQRDNPLYDELHRILAKSSFDRDRIVRVVRKFDFQKPTMQRVRQLFIECHAKIWKMDKRSPASSFSEFVKLMFVKLYEDRELRKSPTTAELVEQGAPLQPDAVTFSVRWIEAQEGLLDNPVDAVLFARLRKAIEEDIRNKKKKRIFDADEHIELRPSTVKEIVRRMEHHDLFGIDEDLNGRLFESFLTATMRGRELGQFFTPRSIVKLMTELADLRVDREHTDTVLDACCGTGGFLIEALTDMSNKVRGNASLTSKEKDTLIGKISNESLYGIDAGVEPPIARIARINMYLHGDGGSRIYFADSLDKTLSPEAGEDAEVAANREELAANLADTEFDVVLTNPPFAMRYELANDDEKRVLEQYDLAKREGGQLRPSLKSSVMFLERYRDLLKPGGKLLTVIDDTVLAGKDFPFVREFIRENFIIRAVISLHGDAFQRSGARAKTSVVYLEKKRTDNEEQPPKVFMGFATRLGIDDPTSQRTPEAEINARRLAAEEEIKFLAKSYKEFLAGRTEPWSEHGPWAVDSSLLSERIDVKFCVPIQGRFVPRWKASGLEVVKLHTLVEPVDAEERTVRPSAEPNTTFRILAIEYAGRCRIDGEFKGRDLKYPEFIRVEEGDLVLSTINAVQGAIAIVDAKIAGALASSNYTVLRCRDPKDTAYLWALLRSSEIRADLLSLCTGFGRHYLYWPAFGEVEVPLLPPDEREAIAMKLEASMVAQLQAEELRSQALSPILQQLDVESEESHTRLQSAKPPR